MARTAAFFVFAALCCASAFAQAGSQADSAFGLDGKVTLDFAGVRADAKAVAVQPDGKIVVVGQTRATPDATSADFAIVRLNANGTLDGTFGTAGKVTTDFFGLEDGANAIALQPDGKIVVAGFASGPSVYGFVSKGLTVARYLTNGQLDSTFATKGWVRTIRGNPIFPGVFNVPCQDEQVVEATGVVVQPDGRVLATGNAFDGFLLSRDDIAVVRYLADGTPDATLLSNNPERVSACGSVVGVRVVDIHQTAGKADAFEDFATDVVLLPDGKFVIGGSTQLFTSNQSNQTDFMLLRLNPNGTPDSTFGTGGVAVTDMDNGLGSFDHLQALAGQPDGKIVSAGGARLVWNGLQFFSTVSLTRHAPGGALDTTFGSAGRVQTILDYNAPFVFNYGATGVALEESGRIVVSGDTVKTSGSASDFRIARYTAKGALDGVFGGLGYVTTDFFGRDDHARAVAIQSDGRIIAVGVASVSDSNNVFAIARYEGGGTCTYASSLWFSSYPVTGGFGYADVTTPLGCEWTATSNAPWITMTVGSGAGAGQARFTLAANPGVGPRTGTVTIAGQELAVTQAGTCQYTLSHTGLNISSSAFVYSVDVTTLAVCLWAAASHTPWIAVTTGGSTTGSGRVTLSISANHDSSSRSGLVTIAGQSFTVTQAGGRPRMTLDRTSLQFAAVTNGAAFIFKTAGQNVRLSQSGVGVVTWTATSNQPWLTVTPSSGAGSATLTLGTTFMSGLTAGTTASGSVTIAVTGASHTLPPVTATLSVGSTSANPVGIFDTPTEGATGITGSVAVTGWALDDIEVTEVQIWRDPHPADPPGAVFAAAPPQGGKVFVGFASFVEGARRDVQNANPSSPLNSRAGWGYLMLTRGLIWDGQGPFRLYAIAADRDGHLVQIGSKTITINNATSTKPFGAIDTPGQGATVSGVVTNFGWGLTPNPGGTSCRIPANGVQVSIDSGPLQAVTYGDVRPDIAGGFAGFTNSAAGGGHFGIDTTLLANGTHTIGWLIVDDCGRADGVGSRFFTVSNGAMMVAQGAEPSVPDAQTIDALPLRNEPISGKRGFVQRVPLRVLRVAENIALLNAEELDRLEVRLTESSGSTFTGFVRVGEQLAPLPIGSRLRDGVFSWQPGVGFVGAYDLVFVRSVGNTPVERIEVRITLFPQGTFTRPQLIIDTPSVEQEVAGRFTVAGWALDPEIKNGTGISTVHVWAYPERGAMPIFLGVATMNGERPDVGNVYGDQFRSAGYDLDVSSVAPGNYTLAAFAWREADGVFLPARTVKVTVR